MRSWRAALARRCSSHEDDQVAAVVDLDSGLALGGLVGRGFVAGLELPRTEDVVCCHCFSPFVMVGEIMVPPGFVVPPGVPPRGSGCARTPADAGGRQMPVKSIGYVEKKTPADAGGRCSGGDGGVPSPLIQKDFFRKFAPGTTNCTTGATLMSRGAPDRVQCCQNDKARRREGDGDGDESEGDEGGWENLHFRFYAATFHSMLRSLSSTALRISLGADLAMRCAFDMLASRTRRLIWLASISIGLSGLSRFHSSS